MASFLTLGISQGGIENVIIEEFYYTESSDIPSLDGATTYRIYLDLAEGYSLQAVFGNGMHPLVIESSEDIFNEEIRGVDTGNWINSRRLDEQGLLLDSFVTLGSISNIYCGVMKDEDTDGSIISTDYYNNQKENFQNYDGLMECKQRSIHVSGIELNALDSQSGALSLNVTDGTWACFGGMTGPTDSNKVLIAQITTKGVLSYEFNVQLGPPEGGREQYVSSNAKGNEILYTKLSSKNQ